MLQAGHSESNGGNEAFPWVVVSPNPAVFSTSTKLRKEMRSAVEAVSLDKRKKKEKKAKQRGRKAKKGETKRA